MGDMLPKSEDGAKGNKLVISIVVPAYNEEKTIATVIENLKGLDLSGIGCSKEIVIVDDGSRDNTGKVISAIKGVKVIRHDSNRGKGAAIKTGIENSHGNIIIIQDADLEYNPKYIPAIVKPIIEGKEKVVYGSRFIKGVRGNVMIVHEIGNKFLSLVTSLLYGQKITDMETGYKAFRRDVLQGISLEAKGFDIEPEITAKFMRKGIHIKEVPIIFYARTFEEGKKITWIDGLKALVTLIKYRFSE